MWLNSMLLPVALAASAVPAPVAPKADDWESVTFYGFTMTSPASGERYLVMTAKAPPGSEYAYRVLLFSPRFGGYLIDSWNPKCDNGRSKSTGSSVTSRAIAGAKGRQPSGTSDFMTYDLFLGFMDNVGCRHRDGSYNGDKNYPFKGQSAAAKQGALWLSTMQ